jgi:hypothetical protein
MRAIVSPGQMRPSAGAGGGGVCEKESDGRRTSSAPARTSRTAATASVPAAAKKRWNRLLSTVGDRFGIVRLEMTARPRTRDRADDQ